MAYANERPPIIYCARCNEPFADKEDMACTGPDEYWHLRCFVCAQCFKPFNKNHEYYDFGGRKYCEKDFQTLFAPCCSRCNGYIVGRFIRALNKCWHPNCLQCDLCQISLTDQGFVKYKNQALCYDCNAKEKAKLNRNSYICFKCKSFIEETEEPLRYKNETYHSYHFNCNSCGIELKSDARQKDDNLYCLKCHDNRLGIPICGACRRPVEERVVTALGKNWHVQHFVCASCEKPFLGKRHYEVKGLAYCEQHYYQLFGHQCHTCEKVIEGDIVSALGKFYCVRHFNCNFCGTEFTVGKSKFYDVGSNPCCKKCYKKFPASLRKRLAKQQKIDRKSKEETEQSCHELQKEVECNLN